MSTFILVPLERFELPTYGFEDRRSIQLSYKGIVVVGTAGFEPTASCPPDRRSTKLSHAPCVVVGTPGIEPGQEP